MPSRVILKMHTSLDGFVCTPDGNTDWIFKHMDHDVVRWEVERLWQAGFHVMGKNLYDIMAAYWPASTEAPAEPMNAIPKIVFSNSLTHATWSDTRIANGDISAEIALLQQQTDKDILVHGGGAFAQSLSRLNLVDEYRFLIHPITLGSGKSCFDSQMQLRLESSHVFPSGVVALAYSR